MSPLSCRQDDRPTEILSGTLRHHNALRTRTAATTRLGCRGTPRVCRPMSHCLPPRRSSLLCLMALSPGPAARASCGLPAREASYWLRVATATPLTKQQDRALEG